MFGLSPSRSTLVEMVPAKFVTRQAKCLRFDSDDLTSRLNSVPFGAKGPWNLALRLEVIPSVGMRILIQMSSDTKFDPFATLKSDPLVALLLPAF